VVTQEIYQREKLLNRVRKLDERAHEEETYWKQVRERRRRSQKLAREGTLKDQIKDGEELVKFVSARLYHQQQQEKEARLNSLYPSRATEAEWIEIQRQCREQPSQQ